MMTEKQEISTKPNGQPSLVMPSTTEIVYYAVPATLLGDMLNVLNQLPRGQVNALATQLEQCKRVGEGSA